MANAQQLSSLDRWRRQQSWPVQWLMTVITMAIMICGVTAVLLGVWQFNEATKEVIQPTCVVTQRGNIVCGERAP